MLKQFIAKKKSKMRLEDIALGKMEELQEQFQQAEVGSEEYYKLARAIKTLQDLDNKKRKGFKVDSSIVVAIITTVGGLLGTILILDYESKEGIVTSAAKAIATKGLGR